MAIEQSIYTCVRKRRDTGTTGFGYYSFTKGFEELRSSSSEVNRASVSYAAPRNQELWWSYDENEDVRSKEEAQNINAHHPVAFSYMPVNINGSQKAILSYGKNLGRDINKSRPGNILVNALIADKSDIKGYPYSYYGSPELFVPYDVDYFYENGAEIPPLLKNPTAITKKETFGGRDILNFIKSDDRLEKLISMFQILLDYNDDDKPKKQIIICDKKENIIYWIAALSILFPLEIAKQFSFTTYSFLATNPDQMTPLYEDTMLCGVYSPKINGDEADGSSTTNYKYSTESNRPDAAVFDFDVESFEDYSLDSSHFQYLIEDFFENNNAGNLSAYQKFIMQQTKYRKIDNDYLRGYSFYLLSLYPEIDNIGCFDDAYKFASKYADPKYMRDILDKLLSATIDKGNVGSEFKTLINAAELICKNDSVAEKSALCSRYITFIKNYLCSDGTTCEDYTEKRTAVKELCNNIGISYDQQFNRIFSDSEILNMSKIAKKKWVLVELTEIVLNRVISLNSSDLYSNSGTEGLLKTLLRRILSDNKNRQKLLLHYVESFANEKKQVELLDALYIDANDELKNEILCFLSEKVISADGEDNFVDAVSKKKLYNVVIEKLFSIVVDDSEYNFDKTVKLLLNLSYPEAYKRQAFVCVREKMMPASSLKEELSNIYRTFEFAQRLNVLDAKTANDLAVSYKEAVFSSSAWYDITNEEMEQLEDILSGAGCNIKTDNETENLYNLYLIHKINNNLSGNATVVLMNENKIKINFDTLSSKAKEEFIERIASYLYKCSLMCDTAFLHFERLVDVPVSKSFATPFYKISSRWLDHLIEESPKKYDIMAELLFIMHETCAINYADVAKSMSRKGIKFRNIHDYLYDNDELNQKIVKAFGNINITNAVDSLCNALSEKYSEEKRNSPMGKFKESFANLFKKKDS